MARLTHPLQVIDQITHCLVILQRRHAAGLHLLPALEDLHVFPVLFHCCKDRAALALQLPKHMGHTDIGIGQVVPACGFVGIRVEGAHVGVEVICSRAARAGPRAGDDAEVWRVGTEPGFGLVRVHGDLHGVSHLGAGEQQLVLDLRFGQANVLQAVVAHESCRMAVQAVIDENLRAVLQGCHVVGLVGRLVPDDTAAAGLREATQANSQKDGKANFFY